MRFPGQILARHKWVVLFSAAIVSISAVVNANRRAYDFYMHSAPEIPWDNIPVSAITYFAHNGTNVLMSMIGLVLAFWSAIGLGLSIGVALWMISQLNPLYIVAFSHGFLEIYAVFLGIVGGFLVLSRIGIFLGRFFGFVFLRQFPQKVDWTEVAEEYLSLFVFSLTGLFVSAWLEASLAYAMLYVQSLWLLIAIINTSISLLIVGLISSATLRILLTGRRKLVQELTPITHKDGRETMELLEAWTICPKCGAYISADIEYCSCGTRLPERETKE